MAGELRILKDTSEHQIPVEYGRELLRAEVGSTLHGTGLGVALEDHDEMGMFIEWPDSTIGLARLEQYQYRSAVERLRGDGTIPYTDGVMSPPSEPGDTDLVVYTLRKWARLALNGNPSVLLPLFAPSDKLVITSNLGEALRDHADRFISKRTGFAFLGYMRRQRARMTGERGAAGRTRTTTEEAQAGVVDWKYAMHMLRLGFQGIEVMRTGRITLPVPGDTGEFLRSVRRGDLPLESVLRAAENLEAELKDEIGRTSQPDEPATDDVNTLLCEFHLRMWHRY